MSRIGPLTRLAMEPPFRLLTRQLLHYLPVSSRTRSIWEVSPRPQYLLGVVVAAQQAVAQGVREIAVVEFGVAGGRGLLALQQEAEAVERETGVVIRVFGFDMGSSGLPEFIGDYRDHPDIWQAGDYAMDVSLLRAKLSARTTLVIGNVEETVPGFFRQYSPPPLGFVAFDLDLYSSTLDALRILSAPERRMLWHMPLYFDNIEFLGNHSRAGELLAITEFNEQNPDVIVDRWHGVRRGRPFPERAFLDKLRVAHDLSALSRVVLDRAPARLPLISTR
jgi:hypothetical protein